MFVAAPLNRQASWCFLVGVIIGLASLRLLLESNVTGAIGVNDGIVAGCVLAIMIGLNIRGRMQPLAQSGVLSSGCCVTHRMLFSRIFCK